MVMVVVMTSANTHVAFQRTQHRYLHPHPSTLHASPSPLFSFSFSSLRCATPDDALSAGVLPQEEAQAIVDNAVTWNMLDPRYDGLVGNCECVSSSTLFRAQRVICGRVVPCRVVPVRIASHISAVSFIIINPPSLPPSLRLLCRTHSNSIQFHTLFNSTRRRRCPSAIWVPSISPCTSRAYRLLRPCTSRAGTRMRTSSWTTVSRAAACHAGDATR